jgi:hypothetical protein
MNKPISRLLWASVVVLAATRIATAQLAPAIGYMSPPGGQAGQTIEVTLGGYDWTPDMQVFVHDPRIKLEIMEKPGPVIVPEPPYWFGKKARRGPFLLPREARARLTIPADVPLGIVRWQAANANGATATGRFIVDARNHDGNAFHSIVEVDGRNRPQSLSELPVTISGQIKKIEEVDRYRFIAKKSGPITCVVTARAIGSPLTAVLEVHDDAGRLVTDAAGTAGNDTALTFAAEANQSYTVSIYDVDFRGNRAYVYRLSIMPGPRVVAAIPAAGTRGETRSVELIGYGVATGSAKLESTTRDITFPSDTVTASFPYHLETSHGDAAQFALMVSDLPETIETTLASRQLTLPAAVTGVLEDRYGEDRYQLAGKKGDVWGIDLAAEQIASPLNVSLASLDASGKELTRSDDLPGSTDAALVFTAPTDGNYQISVSDVSGHSGKPSAVYRLTVTAPKPDFVISTSELLNAPIGGKATIALKTTRRGGFTAPISIALTGLQPGVTAPDALTIPEGKNELKIELTVAADAVATASLTTIVGEVKVKNQLIRRTASPLLIATTIKPPFSIDAEGKDDVTKWPRGTTFPAPVLIERDEGFQGEILLEMTSRQGRHRQGITGPELTVPPGVSRIPYPVFLPEWLETTRTSRMVVNGVAKVADLQGNIRYSVARQKNRMGFLAGGALLKISTDVVEFQCAPGQPFSVPITISRAKQLTESVCLELSPTVSQTEFFTAEPKTLSAAQTEIGYLITVGAIADRSREHKLTIRATVLKNGKFPMISETTIVVQFGDQVDAE